MFRSDNYFVLALIIIVVCIFLAFKLLFDAGIMTWEHFERGSSPVDWCEANYIISPNIAEFVNTISNILFILGPPLLIHLFKDYGKYINQAIHVTWVLLFIVGISSAYFHATLSLIGQLLDEISILWVFMATFCQFCPKRYLPRVFSRNHKKFCVFMGFLTIAASILSVWHPAVNAFALMLLVIPVFNMLYHEIRRVDDRRVFRLGIRCSTILVLAIICWLNDRLLCAQWSAIKFPYLHGFWHILIFISSYNICVLFAYFFVHYEKPYSLPVLKYWPKDDFELGIPFVSIQRNKCLRDQI